MKYADYNSKRYRYTIEIDTSRNGDGEYNCVYIIGMNLELTDYYTLLIDGVQIDLNHEILSIEKDDEVVWKGE